MTASPKRRTTLAALLLAFLIPAPAHAAEKHPFSVEDMLAMERISDPRVSPDGTRVTFTLRVTDLAADRGRTDLYGLELSTGKVRRLTTHPAGDSAARWAPDGQSLFFLSTRDGSSQVYRLPLSGGEAQPITREPLDVENLAVSPDGRFLLISMAVIPGRSPAETRQILDEKGKAKSSGMIFDRLFVRHWDTWTDGTRNHLFVLPLPGGPARDLMPAMDADCPSRPFGGFEETDIAPDGKSIVFSARDAGRQEPWSTNFDLYEVPADGSRAPRKITDNPAWDTQPRFSPDGRQMAYLAMSRAGYEADRYRIVVRQTDTGRDRSFDLRADGSPLGDRSPADILWSADGKEIYAIAEHLGQRALFAMGAESGEARIVVSEGTLEAVQRLPKGNLLFAANSLQGPTELYSVPAAGGRPEKRTRINDERMAAVEIGAAEQFTFPGSRRDKVYGYVVRPARFDPKAKYPVAFLIHGGPQGSFGNDFHYRWNPQFYAGAGYAVVMIDFHGSTGYGQAFTDAINGDWGGAPYEDLMMGLDAALARYPFLDAGRIGALGASYGGYMINWIAGKTDRFRCLVNHDGNLDERMAYYDTEELWFPEWEHGGTPWENPEGYARHNPIDLVKNWKTPMLVIHGVKDYRVVYTQGLSTFTALQRRGIPSRLLIFPDENHWVLKPQNSLLWHRTVLGWLNQWLKQNP